MLSPQRSSVGEWIATWNALPAWQKVAAGLAVVALCVWGIGALVSRTGGAPSSRSGRERGPDQPRSVGFWERLLEGSNASTLPSREGLLEARIERSVKSFEEVEDATARVQLSESGVGAQRASVFLVVTPRSAAALPRNVTQIIAEAARSALPASATECDLRIASSRPAAWLYTNGRFVGPATPVEGPGHEPPPSAVAPRWELLALCALAGAVAAWVWLQTAGLFVRRRQARASAPVPGAAGAEGPAGGERGLLEDLTEDEVRTALAGESEAVIEAAIGLTRAQGAQALHPRVAATLAARVRQTLAAGAADRRAGEG